MTMQNRVGKTTDKKEIKGFEKVDLTAKIQEFNNKKQELENMRRQQMEYHRIFENNNSSFLFRECRQSIIHYIVFLYKKRETI